MYPHDWPSEQTVLGGILLDPSLLPDLLSAGTIPADFDKPCHKQLFSVMCKAHDPSLDGIFATMRQSPNMATDLGGWTYIAALPQFCPSIEGVLLRAQSLTRTSLRREAHRLALGVVAALADPLIEAAPAPVDVAPLLAMAAQLLAAAQAALNAPTPHVSAQPAPMPSRLPPAPQLRAIAWQVHPGWGRYLPASKAA